MTVSLDYIVKTSEEEAGITRNRETELDLRD
jgi:hypothetical protein